VERAVVEFLRHYNHLTAAHNHNSLYSPKRKHGRCIRAWRHSCFVLYHATVWWWTRRLGRTAITRLIRISETSSLNHGLGLDIQWNVSWFFSITPPTFWDSAFRTCPLSSTWIETRSGRRLCWLKFFVFVLSPSRWMSAWYPERGHNFFPTHRHTSYISFPVQYCLDWAHWKPYFRQHLYCCYLKHRRVAILSLRWSHAVSVEAKSESDLCYEYTKFAIFWSM
jgi:hypothetical protein